MKKSILKSFGLLMAICGLYSGNANGMLPCSNIDKFECVENIQSTVRDLSAEIEGLKARFDSFSSRIAALEDKPNTSSDEISELKTELTSMASRMTDLEAKSVTLLSGVASLKTELSSGRNSLDALLAEIRASKAETAAGMVNLGNKFDALLTVVTGMADKVTNLNAMQSKLLDLVRRSAHDGGGVVRFHTLDGWG